MLSCGEPSGDLYAGALARELVALDARVRICGLGGPALAAAGAEIVADYRGLAVTGLTEALATIPRSLAVLRRLVARASHDRPDALVVIDFPDFNFRLAHRIKRLGIPVVYYISPQLWAWRRGRLRTMKQIADRVLVIFPFEEAIYREAGIPVSFVGHPLIDLARPGDAAAFRQRCSVPPGAPLVAILPGSRPNEVRRILPRLLEAAARIRARLPQARFVIARAPNLDQDLFDIPGARLEGLAVVERQTDEALEAADLALTASGTATVQAAIHDTPMVIVYCVSPVSYQVLRRLVRVDSIGMVNLIAGERIVPELVQDAFTPEAVASEAVAILTDAARRERIARGLARVRERLGAPGASRRAAQAVLAMVEGA